MPNVTDRLPTEEFELEAVRQVALSEKPKAELARELGVGVGQLRTWRVEFEKEAVFRAYAQGQERTVREWKACADVFRNTLTID